MAQIAALHEHQTQALQLGQLDYTEFNATVDDIGGEIECGLTRQALEGFKISDDAFPEVCSTTMLNQTTLITLMFSYMASVYLHLVAYGFQRLELVDTTISGAVRIFQTYRHLLPALVSPLYIIGCVNRQGDEQ
jgi:hypothetical protein